MAGFEDRTTSDPGAEWRHLGLMTPRTRGPQWRVLTATGRTAPPSRGLREAPALCDDTTTSVNVTCFFWR